jgi:F-type H+-transporting ATPase subunit a
VTFDWNGKRRWIALLLVIAGVIVMLNWPPVVPVIQLPGEVYPGREIFGLPITNTFVGSIVVWILIGLLIYFVNRNRPSHGGEVPRGGFYNFFEMAFEGLYGFIGGIAPIRYLDTIFKMFMTIFLIVLLSNWLELIPGVDSIGFLEPHVHVEDGHEEVLDGFDTAQFLGIHYLNGKCPWVSPEETAAMTAEEQVARLNAGCKSGTGAPVEAVEHTEETTAEAEGEAVEAEAVETEGEETTAEEGAVVEEVEAHHYASGDPSVPWVVLPYIRVPSTDINLTLALALIAVVTVQVMGFRALGLSYLTKFFNFGTLLKSPLGGIDVAVGLLELIGEFAKILSFAFRLLGNIFAGSILLFVMSFLVPVIAPWPFFLLEFGVGIIQALVFGMLTAIFMSLATVSHHHEEEHHEPEAAH